MDDKRANRSRKRVNIPPAEWGEIARGWRGKEGQAKLNQFIERYYESIDELMRLYLGIHDAELRDELRQSFMAEKVATGSIFDAADQIRGRFRDLLAKSVVNHCRNELKSTARKRERADRDFGDLERRVDFDLFDKTWASGVLVAVANRMQAACTDQQMEIWSVRSVVKSGTVGDLAERLGIGVRTVYREYKRAREAYQQAVMDELSESIDSGVDSLDEVLTELMEIIGRGL